MQITLDLPDSLSQTDTLNQSDWLREIAIAEVTKAAEGEMFDDESDSEALLHFQLAKRDRPSTTNPVIYDLRGAAIANLAHEVHGNQIAQPEEPQ